MRATTHANTRRRMALLAVVLLAFALAACGGGGGGNAPSASGSFDTGVGGGDAGAGSGGDGGMVLPPFDASTLTGGVLATFAVGEERFRGWFTRAEDTQRLVDAFRGTGAPINSLCMRLRVGAPVNGHNAPWSWHVDTLLPTDFDRACQPCAAARDRPSVVEAAVGTPGWLNCTFTVGNAVGIEARAAMQVSLVDVVDRR